MDSVSNSQSTFNQRALYSRLLSLGINGLLCMRIMALWLWFEYQGHPDIVKTLCQNDEKFLTLISVEAQAILARLTQSGAATPLWLPHTARLLKCCPSLQHIFVDRQEVFNEVRDLYNGACKKMFQDIWDAKKAQVGEGSSRDGDQVEAAPEQVPVVQSKLNPCAEEWNLTRVRLMNENDRCLFLTFARGNSNPFTELEIATFFNEKFGIDSVERVYLHWPREGDQQPMFGKVVFRDFITPTMILHKQPQVRFVVNGRDLWCKKFEPPLRQRG